MPPSTDVANLKTIKAIIILDNDGNRILSKYYDETYPTVKEQKGFEKTLFKKTHRANSEIVMFEGVTAVYRSVIDLFFYVVGASDENELLLASVLNSYYEAIALILRDNVEKARLFENMDSVMLITDEIVDGGIILEADPHVLAQAVATTPSTDKVPLAEQSLSQALNTAGGLLRKHLLS